MRRLPIIEDLSTALPSDGRRGVVVPADVKGRFTRARRIAFGLLVAFWLALPTFRVAGHPIVFIDVGKRQFYVFGATFNAQDTYLLFFALTGTLFTIAAMSAVLGRVWCGWMCPQTVFLEGIYRPIERIIEDSREARLKRERHGWSVDLVARKTVKHLVFLAISTAIAHVFVSLFVSMPALFGMIAAAPSLHLEVFVWVAVVTLLLYGNFGFFREQLCLIICPYGRFQAALVDDDTVTIGYDVQRGEPRGKGDGVGDCVDCHRCVVVCPTGIDIRNGAQLDCIGCAACIDACDDIMTKLHRPTGLVRYDSLNGLQRKPKRIWRPRLALYAALLVAGVIVSAVAFAGRAPFVVSVVRPPGVPWVVEGTEVRNTFRLRIANKHDRPARYVVRGSGQGLSVTPQELIVEAAPMGTAEGLFVVIGHHERQTIHLVSTDTADGRTVETDVPFLAPDGAAR